MAPSATLHLHANTGGFNFLNPTLRLTNSTTGTGAGDGFALALLHGTRAAVFAPNAETG
jgi:hypothetical protein